jgi:small subunit ribosomal protein S3|tara:strand:- start:31 stop:774 length:744 start_codon:yes stop_codon:yes gene_type:complete
MGQKVNSIGFRLRHRRKWDNRWFSEKEYSHLFYQDYISTNYLTQIFEKRDFFVSRCIIKRSLDKTFIFFHVYTPTNYNQAEDKALKEMKNTLEKINKSEVIIYVINTHSLAKGFHKPIFTVAGQLASFKTRTYFLDTLQLLNTVTVVKSAPLLARYLAKQLEVIYRHSQYIDFVKKALPKFLELRSELSGIRVQWKGRLSGSDRSKKECFQQGQIPLHTMDAKIDYGYSQAFTIYGTCGVKVWICIK